MLEGASAAIEPALHFDATDILHCGCAICQQCRAARTLHFCFPELLATASHDADLQRVVASWTRLRLPVRIAIDAMVQANSPVLIGDLDMRPPVLECVSLFVDLCFQLCQFHSSPHFFARSHQIALHVSDFDARTVQLRVPLWTGRRIDSRSQ
jgi:hypothetical protein